MEGLIYDDEILPELEVEELLTLDDMLRHQPSFVAFNKDEINVLLQQLLGSSGKADHFQRIHSEYIAPRVLSLASRVLSKVAASLIVRFNDNQEENDDDDTVNESDVQKFNNEMVRAKEAPNYILQKAAVDRLMVPFETNEELPIDSFELKETYAPIELSNGNRSSLLEDDPIRMKVVAAKWVSQRRTSKDYVSDTLPNDIRDTPVVEFKTDKTTNRNTFEEYNDWIKTSVRPIFASVIEDISKEYSLHDIERVLARYGYDFKNLDVEHYTMLKEHVTNVSQTILENDKSSDDHHVLHDKLNHMSKVPDLLNVWDISESIENRISGLLTENDKQRLEDMYGAFLQSIPPLPGSIELPEPYTIARHLNDGTMSLEEVVTHMKQWYYRWEMDIVTRFMEKVRSSPIADDLKGSLIRYMNLLKRSVEKTNALLSNSSFISTHSDIAEIKEGANTIMYDGSNNTQLGIVFEETKNDGDILEMFDDESDDDEMILPESVTYDVPLPSDILNKTDISEGVKEVLACAWTKIHRIAQASGLPCQPELYVNTLKSRVSRMSRVQALHIIAPSMSYDAISYLLTSDVQTTVSRIHDLHSDETVTLLASQYPKIHKEWETSCMEVLIIMLTEWWLHLTTMAVEGTLEFNISTAMIQHIGLWNPYGGLPLETDGKSRTGILYYMTAVIHSLYPSIQSDVLQLEMTQKANDWYGELLNTLKTTWDVQQKNRKINDNAKQAKQSLVDAIVAIKAKQKVNIVPTYIQAMLYLPGVLPSKRTSTKVQKWVQGCCATKLDETFEADIDWKDSWRDLHMIKFGLSKKRWSQEPRKALRMFDKTKSSEDVKKLPTIEKTPEVTDDLEDPQLTSKTVQTISQQTWISRSHIEMLTNKPMDVHVWSRTILNRVYGAKQTAALTQTLNVVLSSNMMLSWISRIAGSLASILPANLLHEIVVPMKTFVRSLRNGNDMKHILQYCFTVVCALPSTIQGTTVHTANNMTTSKVSLIRETILRICTEYNKNGLAMTSDEIQRYITKKREQQKQISLAKMDVLTTDDRQLMQDAKKLKLVKLIEEKDMVDTTEIDGIFEFRMKSQDEDDNAILMD